MPKNKQPIQNFNALKLSLASPDDILNWSHGEVTKAETINYRTFKPEKDGLFCERIFGPERDYECYCGKYKGVRYKGVICDKCGVEVTRALVRRERMGHLSMATPVVHTWFICRTPYKIPLLLDMRPSDIKAVVYFASYVILSVDDKKRENVLKNIQSAYKRKSQQIQNEFGERVNKLQKDLTVKEKKVKEKIKKEKESGHEHEGLELRLESLRRRSEQHQLLLQTKEQEYQKRLLKKKENVKKIIGNLTPRDVLSEEEFEELDRWKTEDFLEIGMGASAIKQLLEQLDLDKEIIKLRRELAKGKMANRPRLVKRLRITQGFKKAKVDPAWMILSVLPIIPPDLRPMVQLSGGRFATSDLNDLYRRVINRNNRLRDLTQLGAPDVILRNEKRMLQEAVDALIEGPRRETRSRRPLKSLSEILKGKQGRFRRNLLGKRVDYSGRSVIIVGPELKVDQVGIPKEIALELFKPFVLHEIIDRDFAPNLKTAKEFLQERSGVIWDLLEEVSHDHPVLLNRAPTLHRQNIQAFYPLLIDGEAIRFHPAICPGFNADFDGDTMSVHLPLSSKSIEEAKSRMLAPHNLLKMSDGKPIVDMKNEMSMGIYYLTTFRPGMLGEGSRFYAMDDVVSAYQKERVHIQAEIELLWGREMIKTTVGRVFINLNLPLKMRFHNEAVTRQDMKDLLVGCFDIYGEEETVKLIDNLKDLGRKYATLPGISFSTLDFKVPEEREGMLEETEKKIRSVESNYRRGLITGQERHIQIVDLWQKTTEDVAELALEKLDDLSMMGMIIKSGSSKVTRNTLRQLQAMRGPMVDSKGEIKETPIRSSTVEGSSSFEGFLSAVGGRKGLIDTALLTANAGYLTRRLVDVAQDALIREDDCGINEGIRIERPGETETVTFKDRIWGRIVLEDIVDPETKDILVKEGELINTARAGEIEKTGVESVIVRSPLTCRTLNGICRQCYGQGMDSRELVKKGEAVGIIAAQSVGEPGTQLTLRTFHAAGIAKEEITQGLPRVDELFEARIPKDPGLLADISGTVRLEPLANEGKIAIIITAKEKREEKFPLHRDDVIKVKNGQGVKKGNVLITTVDRGEVKATQAGKVRVTATGINLRYDIAEERSHIVSETTGLKVKDGELVTAGDVLTEGSLSLGDIIKLKDVLAAQLYLLKEIQKVYNSQAVDIHDKHVEVLIRKMSEWVKINYPGDSDWVPGDRVNWLKFDIVNKKLLEEKKMPAVGARTILGVSRSSLLTESWLSAASFERTTNVLAATAIGERQQIDYLTGLKENVIIGKLIPVS
ncbi:DNA-directed RNA polymerase subunit beta' [Patescibacteria group bacterium]|nr:DNA-directed RNA polymerase subunit beta' [Patescibacteria group bacterium]